MPSDWNRILNKTVNKTTQNSNIEYFIEGSDYFKHLSNSIQDTSSQEDLIYISGWMLDVNFNLIPEDDNTNLLSLLSYAVSKRVSVRILLWDNPFYYKTNLEAIDKLNQISDNDTKHDIIALFDNELFNPVKARKALKILKNKLPLRKWSRELIADILSEFVDTPGKLPPLDNLFSRNNVASHHEKFVVIKNSNGLMAYCGGMDINKNRISKQFDIQCCVHSDCAQQILKRFYLRWKVLERKLFKEKRENLPPLKFVPQIYHSNNDKKSPVLGVISTYNSPTSNTSEYYDRSAKKTLLAIIKNAKDYIYIEDQYMISLEIAKALHLALRRGLKHVIILTQDSKAALTDIFFPYNARREFYITLKHGHIPKKGKIKRNSAISDFDEKVRIYQIAEPTIGYNSRWRKIVHSKLLIADDEIMTIGSFNCNYRSLNTDSEIGVVIYESDKKSEFSIKDFKRKLFRRYYFGPPLKEEVINDLMDNTYDWNKNSVMIKKLDFFGEDLDTKINKFLHEYAAKARLKSQILLDKKGIKTLAYPYTDKLINYGVELAQYSLSKEFKNSLWDIVEAHYGPKNMK